MATTYRIIDCFNGVQVGSDYKSRRRAWNKADRLDLEYGAKRYRVQPIFEGTDYCHHHNVKEACGACREMDQLNAIELGTK